VKFVVGDDTPRVLIPAAALVTRAEGTFVPVLDDGDVVRNVAVQTGRDFGSELEVIAGLQGGETVVVHPGDAFPEGTRVSRVEPAQKPTASRGELVKNAR
jgi:hypothetical protein